MNYTEMGTKIKHEWMPLAMANGIEWGKLRAGQKDKYDCLYRKGVVNKALWHIGVVISRFVSLR